jgi:hypothetical protein
MRGAPKWFNTRTDVENWRAMAGDDAYKATIQRFYDARMIWVTTGELTEGQAGVEDATHRVITNMDMETQAITLSQQELQVDTNAYLFTRLGYTDGEILAILGQ